ncbi:hypothetical protein BC332_11439 [Capsicum chinense]|nr:hypothetical protein BC332_11439 [Capsicum chinense]
MCFLKASRSLNLAFSIFNLIDEMRKLIGPLSGQLALYCCASAYQIMSYFLVLNFELAKYIKLMPDASISRYLTARSWNVKKAAKMLKTTLQWRFDYKPEEIRWVLIFFFTIFKSVWGLFLDELMEPAFMGLSFLILFCSVENGE